MTDSDITSPPSQASEAGSDAFVSPATASPTWQEQDVLLRGLWTQNKTPQEISASLGRSVAAIMTRAARLGLPRRSAPGRKPGSRRVPQSGDIPISSPRPSFNKQEAKDPQASTRICLMCLRSFPSAGRHNRICSSCKNSAEYESAMSLSDINLPI